MVAPNLVHDVMRRHTIGDGEHIVVDRKRSRGSWLVDAVTGRAYLDCASQFASQPLGWNHPELAKYAETLGQVALCKIANSDYYSVELAEFVESFAGICPDFSHFFFVEGGTLGVENALKAAFDWKARRLSMSDADANGLDVIHFQQAFHGRSGYTLSLTNTLPGKTAFFPKFKWSRISNPKLSFPMVEAEAAAAEERSLAEIAAVLEKNRTAAIILEPIQAEGGDNHFRPEFLQALRKISSEHDVMLILDEVQTGVGLTGKMWAYQHFGIVPDMIAFGKKTQVCGFCSTTRIDEDIPDNVFTVSSRINSTWGGNIVDMVRFTIFNKIIQEEKLVENAAAVGAYLLENLQSVSNITQVRGRGLMIAFDLETVERRDQVLKNLRQNMAVLPCGRVSIRLRPHLTFSKSDADVALEFIRLAAS